MKKKTATKPATKSATIVSLGGYQFTLTKDFMRQDVAIGEDPSETDGLYFTPRAEIYNVLTKLDRGDTEVQFNYYVMGSAIAHRGSAHWSWGDIRILNIGCMEFTSVAQRELRKWTGVVELRAKAKTKKTAQKRKAA